MDGINCCATYMIKGAEEVYDAFDEYEHDKEHPPFRVEAASLEEAIEAATRQLQEKIDFERGLFVNLGTYIAKVREVSDVNGKIVYQNKRE
jgi:hypothetical protein